MNRRGVLASMLALMVAPFDRQAMAGQLPRARPFRIGLIPDLLPIRHEQIAEALRELGWLAGSDYVLIQSGIPAGHDIERSVQRVMDEQPDLILAGIIGYVLAAHKLTKTIPIVMWTSGYPVEAGVATSLARPGGNVTGLAVYAGTEVFGKLLDLLRQAKPGVSRVGVLWAYVPPFHPREEIEPCYRELREAARRLEIELSLCEVGRPEDTHAALAEASAARVGALLLTSGAPLMPHRVAVTKFAVSERLPTITDFAWPGVEPQPLMRYSPSPTMLIRQAVAYVDRILRQGASPGELPIQRPAKFELEVNLRTAKSLGLTVPATLLLRADRVIE